MLVATATGAFMVACAPDPWPYEAQKAAVVEYPKTAEDQVFVCWQKPVEKFEVIGSLKIHVSEADIDSSDRMAEVINYMRERASRWGANGLWLQPAPRKKIYTKTGDVNWTSFVQFTGKKDGVTQHFIEAKALMIEDPQGTHGSDDVGSSGNYDL